MSQETLREIIKLIQDRTRDPDSRAKQYRDYSALIGLLYCGKVACSFSSRLYEALRVHFLARLWKTDLRQYGEWALVTGCTSGIGKEYARHLAARGLNIVLVGRHQFKLEAVKAELECLHKVKTVVVVADLATPLDLYREIWPQIKGLDIGILINNAGVMYDQPSRFCKVPLEKLNEHITINMQAVMLMTYILLPQMLARKKGLIVNLSSISALHPLPLMTVYSASKAFVDWFSQGLDAEYKSQGIVVQSLVPSYVSTRLVRFSNFLSTPSFLVPDARSFVSSALDTVGYSKRTTGFWSHGLQYWWMENIPQWIRNWKSQIMFRIIDSSIERKF